MKRKLLMFLLLCCMHNLHAQYDFHKVYTDSISTDFLTAKQLYTYNESIITAGSHTLASVNKQGYINWAKNVYVDSSTINFAFFPIEYHELVSTPDGGFIGLSDISLLGIVSRFDSLGNEIWSKSMSHLTYNVIPQTILRTSSNEYILVNSSVQSSSVAFHEWRKIDINGNVIWQKNYLIPNGFWPEIIKENGLGYLLGSLDGTVAQIDFNGNVLWIREHSMRIADIFPMANNEYIIVGANPGYYNQIWSRLTNTGSQVWTKLFPISLVWGNNIFLYTEPYQQLNDGNIMDIKAIPSSAGPNIWDISMKKLNTQTGNVMWEKRYVSNLLSSGVMHLRSYAIITDSIFSAFTFTSPILNQNKFGHYMRIDVGYHPNPTGCVIQDIPIIANQDTTITHLPVQSLLQFTPASLVQDTNLVIIDVPLEANVVCENGVAANFVVDDFLLCVDDCITVTDSSSGAITSYEWTFFGSDTTYHFTEFPPQLCYPDSGVFSIQLVVSDGFMNDTMRKTIRVFDLPEIDLGNDTTLCQGQFIVPIFSIPYANFSWSTGATTPFSLINNSGTYSVEVTAGNCYETDTIDVIFYNIPNINLGNDTTFCNQNSYNIIPNTVSNVNYLWNTNDTTSNLFINNSGVYTLTVTDTITNCQATDSVEINLNQTAIFDLGNDTIICQGESILLDVFTPNAIYLWNNNSTDSILFINNSGTYSVDVTVNNCTTSDTINIIVADLPTVDLGNDSTFCNEIEYNLIANTSNNVNYLWNTNDTTSSIFINNSGIYTVVITDTLTNCQATDSVEMTFIQTNLFDLGNDTVLCDTQILQLNAFVPNANYLWNNGSTLSEILVTNSGLYSVEVSIDDCVASDIINVNFVSPMNLNLGEDRTLCNDETLDLDVFDANAQSYLWQNNSTNSDILVNQAGTYFVTVFYNENCQVSDTITFTAEGEIYPILPNDTIICQGNSVTLNAYQPNAISYEWQTVEAYFQQHNLQDSVIIATLPGEYKVTISNECRAFTQTITIEEEDCGCYPYIPNAFTPNNDGNNDIFEVYSNCFLSNYNLKIFDRWGGILFETDDVNKGWDGTTQGQELKNGVYVWILTYDAPNEKGVMEKFVSSGSLTLIK